MENANVHVCTDCASSASDMWLGITEDPDGRMARVRALGANVAQAWALFSDGREIGILDLPADTGICPCCSETKESPFYGLKVG